MAACGSSSPSSSPPRRPINDSDGYALPSKLIGAALKAYTMLVSPREEAAGARPRRPGLRQARDVAPGAHRLQGKPEARRRDPAIREAYEQMRVDHGFRVTDYKVDTDTMPPRACFEMSEPVSRTVTDFTSYFTQEPGPVAAVTAEGTRLCVEGLKYGERYTSPRARACPPPPTTRLAKDFSFEFYVRDRNPSVRFAGKAYVLPRTGQNGIPLISVNSKEAKLSLYRIGDRNLIDSVIGSDFRTQISGYSGQRHRQRPRASSSGKGTIETPSPQNEDITTAFPVDEAMGKLEPGLYVMTAATRRARDRELRQRGHAVVRRLRPGPLDHERQGRPACHRALDRHRRIPWPTPSPPHRPQQRGAGRRQRPMPAGTCSFDAGLMKGEGGAAPALVVAQSADGDYSFIDLSQPAFDLTDRGVDGRAPPGPVDAFVYAERGVYRRGETVHATVLLRDDKANAMTGTPLTLVVERPDGVAYLTPDPR